jgi:hypothetical protein
VAKVRPGISERAIEPTSYVLLLTRVQLLITVILVVLLSDLVMTGAMREAFRFSIFDAPREYPGTFVGLQFLSDIVALILACAALRTVSARNLRSFCAA